ncbi:MAG: asparaginase [Rhodobacteraceae bacterium]|nr:asparaginase [Paracoccaceae bacterium]
MGEALRMIELWRGGRCESAHAGHAAVVDAAGALVEGWGDPGAVIYPRSACKMVQALPLVESGAADALGPEHLALACASHSGAAVHTGLVARWLADLGLGEGDLRCGPQEPGDRAARDALIRAGQAPCQIHNNCSGKHTGFLMLNRHLGGGPEYVAPDHKVQQAVRAAFEEVTGAASPGFGIDGCSAPNFATSVSGLARAMAAFAAARADGDGRARAMVRLREAMMAHPDLVAGEGRACTILMRALAGRAAVKTGAEGVFVAIVPGAGLGIALKIVDGATRGAEAAIVALLARLGLLDPAHPAARTFLDTDERNRRGLSVGTIRAAPGFP